MQITVHDDGHVIVVTRRRDGPDPLMPSEVRSQRGVRIGCGLLSGLIAVGTAWVIWRLAHGDSDALFLAIVGSVMALGSFLFAATYDEIDAVHLSVILSAADAEQFRAALAVLPMSGQEGTLDGPAAEHMWLLALRLTPPEVG